MGKGKSTKKGGKKPTLLKLNPDNGYVIGIEIKHGQTTVALANLESEMKAIEKIGHGVGASIDEVIPNVFKTIDLILIKNGINIEKLVSIGIGTPGFIDYEHGELIFADTLSGWANLPLASRFSERYNVPTILENDANAFTLGESLLGAGRGTSNLVCIWIGEGLGSGIMVDGQLVRGETGNAGEIGYLELGHFVVNSGSIKNLYTDQRFFGPILSELNLTDVLRMKLQWNSTESNVDFNQMNIEEMLLIGDQGNIVVQEILNEYAYLLMILCMHFIKTINPSLIILSGRAIENSHYLLEKVRQLVKQSMLNMPFKPSSIVIGELKEQAGVKGAIAIALQTIFEPPLTKTKNHFKSFV
jgi:glucokinase